MRVSYILVWGFISFLSFSGYCNASVRWDVANMDVSSLGIQDLTLHFMQKRQKNHYNNLARWAHVKGVEIELEPFLKEEGLTSPAPGFSQANYPKLLAAFKKYKSSKGGGLKGEDVAAHKLGKSILGRMPEETKREYLKTHTSGDTKLLTSGSGTEMKEELDYSSFNPETFMNELFERNIDTLVKMSKKRSKKPKPKGTLGEGEDVEAVQRVVEVDERMGDTFAKPIEIDKEEMMKQFQDDALDSDLIHTIEGIVAYAESKQIDPMYLDKVLNPLMALLNAYWAETETYILFKAIDDIIGKFINSEEGKEFLVRFNEGNVDEQDPLLKKYALLSANQEMIKSRMGESSIPLIKKVEENFGLWLSKQVILDLSGNRSREESYIKILEEIKLTPEILTEKPVLSLFLIDPVQISLLGLDSAGVFINASKMMNGLNKVEMEAVEFWCTTNKRLIKSPLVIDFHSRVSNRILQPEAVSIVDQDTVRSFTRIQSIIRKNERYPKHSEVLELKLEALIQELKLKPPPVEYENEYLAVTDLVGQTPLDDLMFKNNPLALLFNINDNDTLARVLTAIIQDPNSMTSFRTLVFFMGVDMRKALYNKIKKVKGLADRFKNGEDGYLFYIGLNGLSGEGQRKNKKRTKGSRRDVLNVVGAIDRTAPVVFETGKHLVGEIIDFIPPKVEVQLGQPLLPPPPPPPPPGLPGDNGLPN